MSIGKQNPKKELLTQIECPNCKEMLDIYKITDVKQKAAPAVKEVTYKIEKSIQTPLTSFQNKGGEPMKEEESEVEEEEEEETSEEE